MMIRIRKVEIDNYRSIKRLDWFPGEGINCLIGPGDSGKSSVLDAIELCLGTRRPANLSDSDFHCMDWQQPIVISLTLGGLDDSFKSIEEFGSFLRGFDKTTTTVVDEPAVGLETVLTIQVTVDRDLEPSWTLFSLRAGTSRALNTKDRVRILAARLAASPDDVNLSLSRYSVLQRLSEEWVSFTPELRDSAREARRVFGDVSNHIGPIIGAVHRTAVDLGVPTGEPKAILDLQALNFRDAAVALHDDQGVPLRCLGTGSRRLLLAGLQSRIAESNAAVLLVDEVEHGLEPHRITRLLNALGSKEEIPRAQVFITTHSTIALQQLNGDQVHVVRRDKQKHTITSAGLDDVVQGTLRKSPSAFLANRVIVCEGASELGLLRGLDDHRVSQGKASMLASGVAYCDAGGGSPEDCLGKAKMFAALGYDVAAFIDNDLPIDPLVLDSFEKLGGTLFTWEPNNALEDALFNNLSADRAYRLLELAEEFVGAESVNAKIQNASDGKQSLAALKVAAELIGLTVDERIVLGKASKKREGGKGGKPVKKHGWFKSIDRMEVIGQELVGPAMDEEDTPLTTVLKSLVAWGHDGA